MFVEWMNKWVNIYIVSFPELVSPLLYTWKHQELFWASIVGLNKLVIQTPRLSSIIGKSAPGEGIYS